MRTAEASILAPFKPTAKSLMLIEVTAFFQGIWGFATLLRGASAVLAVPIRSTAGATGF